ncbi:MAG: ATP synthase F1 subunit delta [Candidatus Margulisiibacteriota bacterium]
MPDLDLQKLYEIAGSDAEKLAGELYRFDHFLRENHKIRDFLNDENAAREDRKKILDEAVSANSAIFKQLLDLLQEKNLLRELPWLTDNFIRLVKENTGIKFAELRSAFPLQAKELDNIQKIWGRKVNCLVVEDRELIGGFVLTGADGQVLDASVQGQLGRLQREMAQ